MTDTDDLVALARECGGFQAPDAPKDWLSFNPASLTAFAARLRAAPAAQGAGDALADCGEYGHAEGVCGNASCLQPAGQQEPTTWVDCGECPNITSGCKDKCSKAEQAQGVSDAPLVKFMKERAVSNDEWAKQMLVHARKPWTAPGISVHALQEWLAETARRLSHSPAPASPPVPQVPEPMTEADAEMASPWLPMYQVGYQWKRGYVAGAAARDALAALGRQA